MSVEAAGHGRAPPGTLLLAALSVLLSRSAAVAQAQTQTKSRYCSRETREADQSWWVTLEVDKRHRPLSRTLQLRGSGYSATWNFPTEHFEAARPLVEFEDHHVVPLSKDAQLPVTATVRYDDRTMWRGEFSNSNIYLVDRAIGSKGRPSLRPGLSLAIGSGELPSLFGVARLEVVFQAANGSELARHVLPMPDWSKLKSHFVKAFKAVEDERRRRRCQPHVIISAS
jgi:hypothetical protein